MTGGVRRRATWRVGAVLGAATLVAGATTAAAAPGAAAAPTAPSTPRTAAARPGAPSPARAVSPAPLPPARGSTAAQQVGQTVIVIGIPGLRWSDVTRTTMPALWRLFERGSAAAMSVRTPYPRTCPIDGWLTLGAGSRATAPHEDGCTAIPSPERPVTGGVQIPGFQQIVRANDDFSYAPRFGLLAGEVTEHAGCFTAVGAGAAAATAGESGQVVARYVEDTSAITATTLAACPVTLIDGGSVPADAAARAVFLPRADALVGETVSQAPNRTTVVVAGIADRESTPHLGALVIAGPGFSRGWLTAESTRHSGLVQLTDLTVTVLSIVGIAVPEDAVGAVIKPTGGRPADVGTAWARLAQRDVAAQTIRDYAGIFFVLLEVGQIVLYAIVGWLLHRRRRLPGIERSGRHPLASSPSSRDTQLPPGVAGTAASDPSALESPVPEQARTGTGRLPAVLRAGALFVASAPAASFLANLVPWWRAVHPAPVLAAAVLLGAVILTVVALVGPWRRWHLLGPAGFVATLTMLVLAGDVIAGGSRLQLASLYGLSTLIAGRFYGFGNVAFAAFAMAAMFAALAFAAYFLHRGSQRAALTSVGVIAVVAILADGWPSWGADFGGVIAMVPGFALLGSAVAGKRFSPPRLAALAAAAILAVGVIAMLDWLRGPGQRSHLGRFVQQIVDGEAGPIVDRKLDAMVRSFTRGPEGIVVPVLLALVSYLLLHPERIPTLERAFDRVPVLRAGLTAMLTTSVLGVLINDSGIQVAAVCLTVATPLVVATCAPLISPAPAAPAQVPVARVRG